MLPFLHQIRRERTKMLVNFSLFILMFHTSFQVYNVTWCLYFGKLTYTSPINPHMYSLSVVTIIKFIKWLIHQFLLITYRIFHSGAQNNRICMCIYRNIRRFHQSMVSRWNKDRQGGGQLQKTEKESVEESGVVVFICSCFNYLNKNLSYYEQDACGYLV